MKSLKLKKFLSFSLAAILMFSFVLISCSDNDNNNNNNKNGNAGEPQDISKDSAGIGETADESEYSMIEDRMKVEDNIEDEDMGGIDFKIGVRDNWYYNEVFIEEETGDIVDDAIYRRNKKIEERFNVKFVPVTSKEPATEALKTIRSGDDAYDLIVSGMISLADLSLTANTLYDWNTIPTVDLSRPWFLQDGVKEMAVNNKLFVVPGEFCLSILWNTYCMYFNKTLIKNYNMEDPYKLVLDGKWTIDKMSEITRNIYQDLNGNGSSDKEDLFGLTTNHWSAVVTYTYSSGMKIMRNNSEGIPEYSAPNEKIYENFAKVYDLLVNNQGTYAGDWGEDFPIYSDNRSVFHNNMFSTAIGLREAEEDFGILPYPKYDESQDKYYTMSDGASAMMAIPTTVKDPNKIGKITAALNAESWKTVIPQYYDIALKVKFTRDDESAKILDMILDGRTFDFGYIYDNWKGYAFYIQDLVANKNDGISSWFEKRKGSADNNLEKILASFED